MKITEADRRFSRFIRTRDDWTCQYCGKKYPKGAQGLHCSHYHSRGRWSTRFDEQNADAHCYSCHQYLGGNPHYFTAWKKKQLGSIEYDRLLVRSEMTIKDLHTTKKELQAEVREAYKDYK